MAWNFDDVAAYLRAVGAFALVSLAFFFGSLDPFLRAAPVTGAAVSDRASAVSVNRYRKGDRLPSLTNSSELNRTSTNPAAWHDLHAPYSLQSGRQVPDGCDPAFSSVSSPSLATVYGRCVV